ncbi:DUF2057 family protein [uncultured Psychrobacter sp.]|uniref:DUF2057 family protein n=1 Tax=uncultured Psychrobacter sp. TaxID=259303 RepID=UPI00345A20D6
MKLSTSLLKKLTISTLLIGASSVSILSHAAVTLLVDDNIKVTAINGQEVEQSLLQPLIREFTLQPGQHAITAKYDRLYKLRRDEHDYLRSGNVSVTAQLADNQTYRLTMPNQPEEYKAAKEYADQPTLAIQQGDTIVASQQSSGGNKGGILSGLGNAIGGIFGGDNAEIQNQRAIAALNQPSTIATPAQNNVRSGNVSATTYTAAPATSTTNTNQPTANTLDSFMQIWLQATPSEREKMRQWIQQ